jgi:hypothetical protein
MGADLPSVGAYRGHVLDHPGPIGANRHATARGYRTVVQTPAAQLPYLAVTNPDASVLSEKVYVQGTSYWWSWAEPITGRHDVTGAANILAYVLRTVSE